MAIKIIKDASGSNIKFEGIDRKPIPVNAYLCGVTVGNGGITIFNPDSPLGDGSPSKVMHNVPYTEFVKADGSVPTSAEDLKADIDAQLIQAAPTDVNIGYKGHWDATTNTPDLAGEFDNGDWFYVGVADTYESVDYNINDIIKYNGTSFDLIPNPNLRIDDIESSAINAYEIVVDADYLGAIKTGSALQPYTDLSVAIANSSTNDSILVKGINIITAEIVLPHALSFYGANNAEIKYANYDVSNGDIFSFTGTNTEEFNFEHIVFKNAGGYGLLLKQTEEINIRNCEFFNNGWDGTQLNTVLDSSTSGLLGYDSTNTELQAFYAGSHASNGGALRIEECRKLMIRESRAEGNLRGFRVQDCGINGGGFLIENQSIGNIESGIYLAAGSLGGSQNITVAINYSAYNANNGLLCIGGINNKFSQNEVNGNWNAGLCAWGSVNLTLRDCGLYDNNRSQYNGIGNTGDAKASIQINDAYSFIPYQLTYNPAMRFIAEILDTQVHYTGLGSNTDKVGFLMTSGMSSIPDNAKNIIKIDDVGFIGQDYAIDLSEVDVTNLRLSLGDNSYQSIGQKAVKAPLAGNYSELPFSNHVMQVPEVDVVVDTLKQTIALHEGVGGNVINTYKINELATDLKANSVDIIQKASDKIQLRDLTLGNVYINGVVAGSNISTMNDSLIAAFNMNLTQYKDFLESEVGVDSGDGEEGNFATFYYIESPDNNFEYPLFKTQQEAEDFSEANGGTGYNTETYQDDLTNTTWYVPTVLFVNNGTSAPVNGVYGTSVNIIWNIQTTDDDSNYSPTFNDLMFTVAEGSAVNAVYKPAGDTFIYNVTNIPTGYADTGYAIVGTSETITDGIDIQHVINVTKVDPDGFGSDTGTITLNVTDDPTNNVSANDTSWTKAIDFSGSNEHVKQVSNHQAVNPIGMGGLSSTVGAHSDSSKTSNQINARPWAVATVFRVDRHSSNQHIWNFGEGASTNNDNIYLRLTASGHVYLGWGREGVGYNECKIDDITYSQTSVWFGVYIAHKGARYNASNATAANLADAFDIRLMSSEDNFASVGSNLSTSTNWTANAIGGGTGVRMDRGIVGNLTIGGRGSNRNFHGKVASMVVTTLKQNQTMPTDNEITKMITDPKKWIQNFKQDKTFRYVNQSANYSTTFNVNTTNSAYATQVWLMGDGTSDSYSNGIRNEVMRSDQNYTKLQLNSMVSNDFENVSINGLS